MDSLKTSDLQHREEHEMETRKIGKQMSKAPANQEGEESAFLLDRREFIMAGVALAATSMFPGIAAGASATPMAGARGLQTTRPIPTRKLGALEVSTIGLGCMSMNGGNTIHPRASAK
jgi:hypothetical protein